MTIVFVFYILFCLLLNTRCDEATLCGTISTFTSICQTKDLVYVLSASPCQTNTSVTLTIIDTLKNTVIYKYTNSSITQPIPIDENSKRGVVLMMHEVPVSNPKLYRDARLHVMLYEVEMAAYIKNSTVLQLIVEPQFPMFYKACDGSNYRNLTWGYRHQETCDVSMRTGEFTTFCWLQKQNIKIPAAIYFTLFDPCSTPYSTNIIVLQKHEPVFSVAFTKDKSDSRIMFSASNDGCGLRLTMHQHNTLEYHITLLHGCLSNLSDDVKLINENYHTELGMICPISNCKLNSADVRNQSCYVPWIVGPNVVVETHMTTHVNLCDPLVSVSFTVWPMNSTVANRLQFFQLINLVADHEEEWHDFGHAQVLHLSTGFIECNKSKTNGYLCLDLGLISLYVHEQKEIGLLHLVILRHYPDKSDAVPLLHTEYWLRREDVCPNAEHHKMWKTIVVGACVSTLLLILIIAIFACYKRRRQQRQHAGGLPYEIHLGEQELEDVSY